MKKLRVLAIMHQDLVPPDSLDGYTPQQSQEFRTEYDVVQGLRGMGHDVHCLGLTDELTPLRRAVKEYAPHVVFNLLEEFAEQTTYDHNVVSYLELLGVPYTGCGPRGLIIARDKGLAKKILHYHRIRTPKFHVFKKGRKTKRPRRLTFPLIVKSLSEEASSGISEASLVNNDEALAERVEFVHQSVGTDVIAEQYVDGRELYVAVMGNERLTTFPIWELDISNLREGAPRIATSRVKWDIRYQKRHGVEWRAASDLSPELTAKIVKTSKRIYRLLSMSGCARIDFRLSESGTPYFLEANPNPDIGKEAEFASAAAASGCAYGDLLCKLLTLGIRAAPPRSRAA